MRVRVETIITGLSDINTFPALKGVLVQDLSYLFSNFGWLLFLFIGILLRRTYKK